MKRHINGSVDAGLLMQDLSDLAKFGAQPGGGVTRPAYSEVYRHAQDWLLERMAAAGLTTHIDGAGNVIGRLGPLTGPAIACGSHIDTVPEGGAFDGALGVLAGVAVARVLAEHADSLPVAFEVIAFSDEEGTYLGEAGARAMTGTLNMQDVRNNRGTDGTPMPRAIEAFGLDLDGFSTSSRPAADFCAFLELHIEQGPLLESAGLEIGVVESIVGLHTSELTFLGQASHAGTTPAAMRRDAFRAAAESVAACFDRVEACFPLSARLTFGRIELQPGATNVVPSKVVLFREVRADSEALIESVVEETNEIAKSIAKSNDTQLEIRLISREAPAAMSESLVRAIETTCKRGKIGYRRMTSGAGHDAQIMAQHCPTGMIFVPSQDGISHHPAEYTSPLQIETGANVLLKTVLDLMESCRSMPVLEGSLENAKTV